MFGSGNAVVRKFALLEIFGVIAVLAIALTVYRGTFAGFFVQDDFGWLESTRFPNAGECFKSFFRFNPALGYRPLSQETFFWLGQRAFGMWPPGFHAVSVSMHLLGAALLYILLRQFCAALPSLTGTLFYAVHGAHFRSVYWISALPEPTALVFFVAAIVLFIRFDRTNNRLVYIFSVIVMGLGMMSKESILSLPLVLAAYCLLLAPARLLWTLPFFTLSGTYVLMRFTSHAVKAAPYPLTFGWGALENLVVFSTWAAGFTETMLKVKLEWASRHWYVVLALAFAAVTLLLFLWAHNRRIASFSIAWFILSLQPVLYFRQHIDPYYLAPSLAAYSLLIAAALPVRGGRAWRALAPALLIASFSLWTAHASAMREGRWWNERTYVGKEILARMPEVDRQVPDGKIAYIFGFTEDDFGVMQQDAALKAYGFPPTKFICVGLDADTPHQIRTLASGAGLWDYYCFVYSRGEFYETTAEFRRNPGHFLIPVGFDATPRVVKRGQDKLRLKLTNFDVPAIDVQYSLDGKIQPPILHWLLDNDHTITVTVDASTRPGVYDFRAIRDARDRSSTAWYQVNVQVTVQ